MDIELIVAVGFVVGLCAFFSWLYDEMQKEKLEESRRKSWQDFERRAQEEQDNYRKMRQRENEEQVQSHKNYINYYRTSKEVDMLIEAFCNGSRFLYIPDQITIFDDRVESTINDFKIVCQYSDYGLVNMKTVCWGGSTEDFRYVCRPQLALAGVINQKLNEIYQINDCAKKELHEHKHSVDDEIFYTMTYTSNYVLLTLKGFKH